MSETTSKKSWWLTVPGIVTAIAGLIAAIASLLVVLNQFGFISSTSSGQHLAGQYDFRSLDGKYAAKKIGTGKDIHYQIIKIETRSIMFVTSAQYTTPNDVKAASFSPDSKKFAAAYHYGHDGGYTWIGLWDIESGMRMHEEKTPGWTTDVSWVFRKKAEQ